MNERSFSMNLRQLSVIAACALSCGSVLALSEGEYKASRDRIDADYKAESAGCDKLSGNAKDVCMAEAKGHRDVAKAELEANQKNTPKARAKVIEEKADAAYKVAKEKCDDLAGNAKDVCVADAKAQHEKAKATASEQRKVGEAQAETRADARDAEYKAAKERCDSYSGETKDRCVADLKARYGK
jgi:hypothetical protein